MENDYEGIAEEGLLDAIIDDEFEDRAEKEKPVGNESDDSEFADVVKELRYQLKFNEFSRKYIKVKIKGKKHKVIPITEFKISGSFVLQEEDGHTFQAKIPDIERWKSR